MKPIVTLLAALTLSASAQSTFTDPANLRGERVRPRDGRELPVDGGQGNAALGLQQILRKLNTRASILNIVAHPDDEDGGMLTLYSRGLGARVADLSLTRGEGGQNAMTGDFEDALGLLRTQELLANDRYTGVDQMFGTEVDFGFSKTKEEAFGKWTHERVLYDAVRAVRLYRPLVITATFIGGVTDGHGQHQVSGEIAQEVFNKAGDPKVFPEMIAEGILPWQPLKVYARVPQAAITPQGLFDYATGQYTPAKFTNYVTGEVSTTPPSTDVVVHEGTTDPLLTGVDGKPLTYVQFSRIGLGLQKSQIPAGFRMPPAGTFDVSYHRYGSRVAQQAAHEDSVFDGIDTSIEGIASVAPHAPPSLRSTLQLISREYAMAQQLAQAGDTAGTIHALYESFTPLSLVLSTLDDAHSVMGSERLPETKQWTELPADERASLRHELRNKWSQADEALALALGIHVDAIADTASDDVTANERLGIAVHATTTSTEPLMKGLEFARIELSGGDPSHPIIGKQKDRSFTAESSIDDKIEVPSSVIAAFGVTRPYFTRQNIEQPYYDLSVPALRDAPQTPNPFVVSVDLFYRLHPLHILRVVHAGPQPVSIVPPASSNISYRPVGYGDLPRTNFFPRPKPQLHNVDLKLPAARRIAYLPGTGDAVPEALASIGLKPEMLTVADLTTDKLKHYDSVVLGVRTYAAHPDLHGAPTQALLDYAKNGGNVVVQYQTAEFTADDAPYPLTLGRDAEKVVDETDAVQLTGANSPLLTTPNKITPADFNNWIEERGHGFLRTWDAHYNGLTETHDPGQDPQRGGLVTVALGKGRWTYVAFALYRQLPEAVPGAYRLFVNLLNP
jgi:LmbE family N-acetylglucosaminyl deacetylase